MTLSLDTNVLVYATNREAGARHLTAVRIIERAVLGERVLALQALAELFHVLHRKARLPAADARNAVTKWHRQFPVAAADADTLHEAMGAVEAHGLSFWDAMLWATVQAAGCTVLLTEDLQDGRRLGRVTFVNPFEPANERIVDAVLPPLD